MSRDLYFRSWDRINKKYVYYTLKNGEIHWNKNNIDSLDCNRKSEEQYTGLNDINGVNIFEGDILFDMWTHCFMSVVFVDDQYQLICHDDSNPYSRGSLYTFLQNKTADTSIKGNIHENPELLES